MSGRSVFIIQDFEKKTCKPDNKGAVDLNRSLIAVFGCKFGSPTVNPALTEQL